MQARIADRVIFAASLTAAVGLAAAAGAFFKPFIYYAKAEGLELIPGLTLVASFVLVTFAAVRCRSETSPFTSAWKLYIVMGIVVALAFGGTRRLTMESSHFFAPERGWEEMEIWLQIFGVAVGFAVLGALAALVIRHVPLRPK